MKIEVESEALDTLKAMAQRLQNERDELLESLEWSMQIHDQLEIAGIVHYDPNLPDAIRSISKARAIIAKCTAEPKVME